MTRGGLEELAFDAIESRRAGEASIGLLPPPAAYGAAPAKGFGICVLRCCAQATAPISKNARTAMMAKPAVENSSPEACGRRQAAQLSTSGQT